MLDFNINQLDENTHEDLLSLIKISHKFLNRFRKRLKVYAGEMFHYYNFNLNLEKFLHSLNEIIQENMTSEEYGKLMEDDRFSNEVLELHLDLSEVPNQEYANLIDFLTLNYQFLNLYLENLKLYGQEIFDKVSYNNKLQRYMEDYKVLLESNLGSEVLENILKENREGFLEKDGEYYAR